VKKEFVFWKESYKNLLKKMSVIAVRERERERER
jgi:hypothetical protein